MPKSALYKVSFTFSDDYRPKHAGFCSCVMVVEAINQFDALKQAWDSITVLELDEPINMDCKRVDRD